MNKQSQRKTYSLNLIYRLLFIVPTSQIILLFYLILIFEENDVNPAVGFTSVLVWLSPILAVILLYSFGSRLVISKEGLINYTCPPFRKTIPWEDILRIEESVFIGTVNLVYKVTPKTRKWTKQQEGVITLSNYIKKRETSGFLSAIEKLAPQIESSENFRPRMYINLWQRTSTLLLYYVFCLFSIHLHSLIPLLELEEESIGFFLAGIGMFIGIISGIIKLWEYSFWLAECPSPDEIKKVSRIYYLIPISAWVLSLIFGLVYQSNTDANTLVDVAGWMIIIVIFIGGFQFRILRTLFRLRGKSPWNKK